MQRLASLCQRQQAFADALAQRVLNCNKEEEGRGKPTDAFRTEKRPEGREGEGSSSRESQPEPFRTEKVPEGKKGGGDKKETEKEVH